MKVGAGRRRLFGLILLLLTAIIPDNRAQTTYYVAATGNDANAGRSMSAPLRSLAKVSSLSLVPGDTVRFRRGDTFRGGLVINQSGLAGQRIVFEAYGTGPKPVLAGSVPLGNWINTGNNAWEANCPDCGSRVTGLYRNGAALPLGRYPNPDAPSRGYLTVQAHVGNAQITSQQPLTTNWTGGEVVVRPTYWIIDRALITRQSGDVLTLANASTYQLTDGWGYFIQNHPATLDQTGEWYYDPGRKTIRIYDAGGNPNQQRITVTTVDRGIDVVDASFIGLRNLHVTETLSESFRATNASNLTLTNSEFTDSGEDGVILLGAGRNVLIENCQIRDINNNGFYVGAYQNLTLRGSTIRHVGLLPGRGKSGDGQFTGLQSLAGNALIENNVIDSIGYNGLTFWSNTIIRQNTVSNFCLTKSDGGGLYGWNGTKLPMSNVQIASNLIHRGIGTPGGTADSTLSGAHGVFLDDCVEGVELVDNTIFSCHGLGIYLHAVSRVSLIRNTCFNNDVGQFFLYANAGPCQPRQNIIDRNLFISTLPKRFVAGYSSAGNDLKEYGSIDHNYYARPFDNTFTILAVYNQTIGDELALPQWQAQFGHDLTSKTSPITYHDYHLHRADATNRLSNPPDRSGEGWGEGWDTWSPHANGRAVWDNTNRLDDGSLRIDFAQPAGGRNSHVLVYKNMRAVTKSKSYLLRFDAVAPAPKKVEVFIRQRDAPYQDLTQRYTLLVGPARKRYEVAFTATADEANALFTFQAREDGQPLWVDNVRLQEATITPVNPADYVWLAYNPTTKDSVVALAKPHRDVKNRYYANQLTLKPFSSVVLLNDSLPPVDVRLSLRIDQKLPKTGDVVSVALRLHNESGSRGLVGNRVQWRCQLPTNLTVVDGAGLQQSDSVLTGTVQHLTTDTTFVFRVRSTRPGTYPLVAQVTATTYADPDSTPDSGLDDGEDDTALTRLVISPLVAADTATIVTGISPVGQLVPVAEDRLVFPNPTTDGFTFVTERPVQTLTVVDWLGRPHLRLGSLRQNQPVQFGERLPAGEYLLSIQYDGGEQRVMKLLKVGR